MMVLKKKELVAASLVILIGVAGYLNWSYQDTISVKDGESYIETGKKLGEAQYVSSVEEVEETEAEEETTENKDAAEETIETIEDLGGYFEEARLNRETARAKSLEILNQTAANENFDAEIRKKAGDKILMSASNIEKESSIESLAQSKGYGEICVYIDDSTANVAVRKDGFSESDVTVLLEIVTSQTDLGAEDIKIVEVK